MERPFARAACALAALSSAVLAGHVEGREGSGRSVWEIIAANFRGVSDDMLENFIYGAPAFAPLLFPNLVILASLGLWIMMRRYAGRTLDAP